MKYFLLILATILLSFTAQDLYAQDGSKKLVVERTDLTSIVQIIRVSSTGEIHKLPKSQKSDEDQAMTITTIMAEGLKFTPDQTKEVYSVNLQAIQQVANFLQLKEKNVDAYNSKINALNTLRENALQGILTPEQFEYYRIQNESVN